MTHVTARQQQHSATVDTPAKRSAASAPRLSIHARAVLAALRVADCHPAAAELYDMVRAQHPRIGLATVYRALARLEAAGLAVAVSRDTWGRHYDSRTDPHDHAVCTFCGSFTDVERPAISLPDAYMAAASTHGHEVRGFEIRYHGRCAACREAEATAQANGGAHTAITGSTNDDE